MRGFRNPTLAVIIMIFGALVTFPSLAQGLSRPQVLTPSDGAVLSGAVDVTWTPVQGAKQYSLTVLYEETDETVFESKDIRSESQVVSSQHLTPGRKYGLIVVADDGAGTRLASALVLFSVAPGPGPVEISSASVELRDTSATFHWSTSQLANSWVEFGQTEAYGDDDNGQNDSTTAHVVTIGPVEPNTTYFFRIRSRSAEGALDTLTGSITTLRTLAPSAPGKTQFIPDPPKQDGSRRLLITTWLTSNPVGQLFMNLLAGVLGTALFELAKKPKHWSVVVGVAIGGLMVLLFQVWDNLVVTVLFPALGGAAPLLRQKMLNVVRVLLPGDRRTASDANKEC